MKYFFVVFVFTCSVFGFGVNISNRDIANGKTALIEFDKDKDIRLEKLVVGKKTYKVFNNPIDTHRAYALLPMSYYSSPKKLSVQLKYKEKNTKKIRKFKFRIVDGNYKKETIKVQSSKVNLNKKDKKRASKEYAEAMKIYGTITDKSYISKKFIVPLDTKITSDFGKARVYNGSLKGYHSGTDFRAKIGTPLIATNDGMVVLAKNRFYSGGSVIVDHGQGIYSCYYHMSKFAVKKGQMVKRGEKLGLSGDTGRVTGPHLHFSFRVGGEQVDPLQVIKLINTRLLKLH